MSAIFQEMLRVGVYKKSQGKITRQLTFAALAITLALGMWRLSETLATVNAVFNTQLGLSTEAFHGVMRYAVPGVLLLLGWWISYRAVNLPSFADFLISVEAEMNKVSWPSRGELFRASIVVLVMLVALAMLLFLYDTIWSWVFSWLGIHGGSGAGS